MLTRIRTEENPGAVLCAACLAATALFAAVGQAHAQAAAAPASKGWESTASAGLTLTRGNSRNVLATAGVQSQRKWEKDEVFLGASAGYGENTAANEKTDDYLKGSAQWNHLFTERLYGGVKLDAVHDDLADLDYRFTLSPLLGYYFVKNDKFRLSGEAGPSFVYEKQGGDETGYIGARLAERFEWKINERAKLWQSVEFIPQVDKVENYLINAELGVDAAITEKLSMRVVLQDTYDHEPAPERQKNDLKLIAGLAYKF